MKFKSEKIVQLVFTAILEVYREKECIPVNGNLEKVIDFLKSNPFYYNEIINDIDLFNHDFEKFYVIKDKILNYYLSIIDINPNELNYFEIRDVLNKNGILIEAESMFVFDEDNFHLSTFKDIKYLSNDENVTSNITEYLLSPISLIEIFFHYYFIFRGCNLNIEDDVMNFNRKYNLIIDKSQKIDFITLKLKKQTKKLLKLDIDELAFVSKNQIINSNIKEFVSFNNQHFIKMIIEYLINTDFKDEFILKYFFKEASEVEYLVEDVYHFFDNKHIFYNDPFFYKILKIENILMFIQFLENTRFELENHKEINSKIINTKSINNDKLLTKQTFKDNFQNAFVQNNFKKIEKIRIRFENSDFKDIAILIYLLYNYHNNILQKFNLSRFVRTINISRKINTQSINRYFSGRPKSDDYKIKDNFENEILKIKIELDNIL